MIISITQKLIDEGVRKDCNSCPTAKAIENSTGCEWVSVYSDKIYWGTPHVAEDFYSMPTPPAIREWMDRYDSGLLVGPISFELEAA